MIIYYYQGKLVKDPTEYLTRHYNLSENDILSIKNNITIISTILTAINLKSELEIIETLHIKGSFLIIDTSTEATHIDTLKKLDKWGKERGIPYVIITSAIDGNELYNELFHPIFFSYQPLQQTDIINRKSKYTCLARIINGREHRILVVQELHRLELIKHGIVSCGSGNTHDELSEFKSNVRLDSEFRSLLPFTFEDRIATRELSSTHTMTGIELSQFHLIIESSYDYFKCRDTNLQYNSNGWSRLFFTEKTSKCINSFQIPLWVAPQGFVQKMRDLKFDVFDDIVNHSYDNILDPEERIKVTTREVQRLCTLELDNPLYNKRLLHNTLVLKDLGVKFKEKFRQSLLKRIT